VTATVGDRVVRSWPAGAKAGHGTRPSRPGPGTSVDFVLRGKETRRCENERDSDSKILIFDRTGPVSCLLTIANQESEIKTAQLPFPRVEAISVPPDLMEAIRLTCQRLLAKGQAGEAG
jgi:hypothetical protein